MALARDALTAGEVPVGAVVADHDRTVSEGAESINARLDPDAHAELIAIEAACRATRSLSPSGVTLYSTVEPRVLCAYVIRVTGIGRVVFGMPALPTGRLHVQLSAAARAHMARAAGSTMLQRLVLADIMTDREVWTLDGCVWQGFLPRLRSFELASRDDTARRRLAQASLRRTLRGALWTDVHPGTCSAVRRPPHGSCAVGARRGDNHAAPLFARAVL